MYSMVTIANETIAYLKFTKNRIKCHTHTW
jgi:hypothetical protein